MLGSSSGGEFHPSALTKPDVMLFVCGRPMECKDFFFGFTHVVRRFHVSGLMMLFGVQN